MSSKLYIEVVEDIANRRGNTPTALETSILHKVVENSSLGTRKVNSFCDDNKSRF